MIALKRHTLAFTSPCLAQARKAPPSGAEWVHETKYDGYRVQALIEGRRVRLLTRTALDWTARFGVVAHELANLGVKDAALDCEAVVLDDNGISRFSALQAELKRGRDARITLIAFDLLHLNGVEVAPLPLGERKQLLEKIVGDCSSAHGLVRTSTHLDGSGAEILKRMCSMGFEGIVSKRLDLPYRAGRNGDWIKVKCVMADPFVVIGYIPSKVAAGMVGSLALGFYDGRRLVYAGRVGSGFTEAEARAMSEGLAAIRADPPKLKTALTPEQCAGLVWIEPRLVAQITYRDVTADGHLRHATFEHFRDDKPARGVARPPAFGGSASDKHRRT